MIKNIQLDLSYSKSFRCAIRHVCFLSSNIHTLCNRYNATLFTIVPSHRRVRVDLAMTRWCDDDSARWFGDSMIRWRDNDGAIEHRFIAIALSYHCVIAIAPLTRSQSMVNCVALSGFHNLHRRGVVIIVLSLLECTTTVLVAKIVRNLRLGKFTLYAQNLTWNNGFPWPSPILEFLSVTKGNIAGI